MHRQIRICQNCGSHFEGSRDQYYCKACAQIKKTDTVIKERICQDCGTSFYGGPRSRRCYECSQKAQKENAKKYRRTGASRPLGSIDKCIICGQEYIVNSGRQKYCSDACQQKGVLAWQREHKKGYHKKSGQDAKKQERRSKKTKVCVYCLRSFSNSTTSNVCSDFCRSEYKKFQNCIADIKRGYKRDLKKYEEKREKYREEVKNDRHNI